MHSLPKKKRRKRNEKCREPGQCEARPTEGRDNGKEDAEGDSRETNRRRKDSEELRAISVYPDSGRRKEIQTRR